MGDIQTSMGRFSAAPLLLLTALFQGLTLIFLSSKACNDNALVALGDELDFPITCSLSTGANLCIAALVFWVAAAVSSFMEGKALEEESKEGSSLSDPFIP